MRRDATIALLESALPELRQRFGVLRLVLFGSVARDEAAAASDVDVLVEFGGATSFNGYFGVKERLEELLGTHVDLATPAMLKPPLQNELERDGWAVSGSVASGPIRQVQEFARQRLAELQAVQDEHVKASRHDPGEIERAIEDAAREVRSDRRRR